MQEQLKVTKVGSVVHSTDCAYCYTSHFGAINLTTRKLLNEQVKSCHWV